MKPIPTHALRDGLARNQSAPSDQSAQAGDPHPDAGLLAAFAEDALLEHERADVLAHLAACTGCRAVLLTAAGATAPEEVEIVHPQPARKPLRLWIPGFTLAAALLVMAASTIFFYRATRMNVPRTQTAASAAPAQTSPAAPALQPALAAAANAAPPASARAPQHPRRASRPRSAVAPPVPETREAEVSVPSPTLPPAAPAAGIGGAPSGVNVGEPASRNAPAPADERQLRAKMESQASAYQRGIAAAKATPRAAAQTAPAESQTAFVGSSHSMGVIAGLMTTPAAHLRFRINNSGQLERSAQAGVWQPVPSAPPARFRVVAISGTDVWAGGDHLRLFHSADNGLAWIEVQLPISADRTQAIAHIRLDSPEHLTVDSNTGATWTTTDAGATWQ